MKSSLLVFALFAAVALRAAEPLPVFNATLTVGREHRFVLVNPAGKASSFLALGEQFDGYTLKNYDPKSGVLEIEREGKVSPLTITADAAVLNVPARTPATIADAQAVMKAMNFEAMMDRMLAGSKKAQIGMVEKMMEQFKRPGADIDAAVTMQRKMIDELLGAVSGPGLKDDMARIYSEVFTKEELQGLADFYATPLGQNLNDKQPEIQEKLTAVMMPRMMSAMPKVQKMMRDFAAEQQAKRQAAGGAPGAPAGAAPTAEPKK